MKNLISDFLAGVGKAPSQIHKVNEYDQSQKKTDALGWYEKANAKLKPRTYVERKAGQVKFLTVLRSLYPVLSVALALVTAYLIGEAFTAGMPDFLKYALIALVGSFVFLITVWVENEKKNSLASVFRVMKTDNVGKGETVQGYGLTVAFTLCFSIAISALGGFELTKQIQDETPALEKAHKAQIDSLNAHFAALVEPYNVQIKTAKETLSKYAAGSWRVNIANENLTNAAAAKAKVLAQQDEALAKEKTHHKKTLAKSSGNTHQLALICAGIVCLFELFYAFSFFAEYTFYAKAERENVNHSILDFNDTNESDNGTLKALTNALQALTTNANVSPQNAMNEHANDTLTHSKIGFQSRNANVNANGKASGYWATRPELCNDLQAKLQGQISDSYTSLAQKHNVCEATVHRVKKSIFEL